MDWTPVTIKKKHTTVQKHNSPLKHLEDDEMNFVKPKMFSQESKQTIIDYRITNKISQSQLDMMCSFPKNTIQQLESNKIGPTTKHLNTLNRILKTGLTLSSS